VSQWPLYLRSSISLLDFKRRNSSIGLSRVGLVADHAMFFSNFFFSHHGWHCRLVQGKARNGTISSRENIILLRLYNSIRRSRTGQESRIIIVYCTAYGRNIKIECSRYNTYLGSQVIIGYRVIIG
jgi:hypothetical protein